MTSDSSPSISPISPEPPEVVSSEQIRLKSEGGRLLLMLPPDSDNNELAAMTWNDLWHQLKQRLNGGDRFWQPDTTVHLIARDRLLDSRQLQELADALSEVQLNLKRVYTSRRQTAVAAATLGYSVEQQSPVTPLLGQTPSEAGQAMAEPLYLQMTVRSGAEIRHPGTVVIVGDVNPGSVVIAEGDILVWGRLRGVAHAGSKGNSQCLIMALQMEPTQIRIAEFVARGPETPPAQYFPEIAYVTAKGIRIAKVSEFSRSQSESFPKTTKRSP
ncbi:MAG: septum site-determining protein MinC [Leptolyngbyaceae cyanobacterium bins.59]|nr:septum site-determining protein MinC [Leptolyngbyaceae cyanobacterium bins.59]